MTPKELWQTAEALVYSVERFDPDGRGEEDYGHYTVVYSYRVGEDRHTGEFNDYCDATDSYFHRDDTISVKYCPEHPEKSFYPDAESAKNKRLIAIGFGACLAVIVMLIVYFSGGFRSH